MVSVAGTPQGCRDPRDDVVIETGPPFHMVEYEVEAGGEALLRCAGDGLILSTPIGSTAHNLAAGGPVVGQELSAFAITPLCPHTLTTRPLVESADKVYSSRDSLRLSDLVPGTDPLADEVLMTRQALHARRLRFTHPRLHRIIEAEAPLPEEFQRALDALRQHRPAGR